MANLARVQGGAAINQGLNEREPVKQQQEFSFKAYLAAAGAIVVGGFIFIKVAIGKVLSWFIG